MVELEGAIEGVVAIVVVEGQSRGSKNIQSVVSQLVTCFSRNLNKKITK